METAQPHKNDILASNLLFIGLVLITGIQVWRIHLGVGGSSGYRPAPTWVWVISLLLRVGLYYAIRTGQMWAKILSLAHIMLGAFGLIYYELWHGYFQPDLWNVVACILTYTIDLVAIALLFKKSRPQLA